MCFALTPSHLFFLLSPHSPAVRSQGDRRGVRCLNAEESHAERPGGSCELLSFHSVSNGWYCISCFILAKYAVKGRNVGKSEKKDWIGERERERVC